MKIQQYAVQHADGAYGEVTTDINVARGELEIVSAVDPLAKLLTRHVETIRSSWTEVEAVEEQPDNSETVAKRAKASVAKQKAKAKAEEEAEDAA